MGIFQYIGNWITELFDFLKSSSNTEVAQALSMLVGVTITIQILIKAYEVAAGKSSAPTQELIWDIALKMLIISVALNLNGFLDLIKLSMEELHNLMSGDKNLYAVLDEKLDTLIVLMKKIEDESGMFDFSSIFINAILFLSFLIGLVPSFITIVMTDITLRLLMLVAPIVIFFRAYSWGKQMFDQWLSVFFTNLLTVFMVGKLLHLFTEKYGSFILHQTKQVGEGIAAFNIAGQSLLFGIVLFFMLKLATTLAEKIGSVGIESSPTSASAFKDSAKGAMLASVAGVAPMAKMVSSSYKSLKGIKGA